MDKIINEASHLKNARAIGQFLEFDDEGKSTVKRFLFERLLEFTQSTLLNDYTKEYLDEVTFNFQLLYDLVDRVEYPYTKTGDNEEA